MSSFSFANLFDSLRLSDSDGSQDAPARRATVETYLDELEALQRQDIAEFQRAKRNDALQLELAMNEIRRLRRENVALGEHRARAEFLQDRKIIEAFQTKFAGKWRIHSHTDGDEFLVRNGHSEFSRAIFYMADQEIHFTDHKYMEIHMKVNTTKYNPKSVPMSERVEPHPARTVYMDESSLKIAFAMDGELEENSEEWIVKDDQLHIINKRYGASATRIYTKLGKLEQNLQYKTQEAKFAREQYEDAMNLMNEVCKRADELKTENDSLKQKFDEEGAVKRCYKCDNLQFCCDWLKMEGNKKTHRIEVLEHRNALLTEKRSNWLNRRRVEKEETSEVVLELQNKIKQFQFITGPSRINELPPMYSYLLGNWNLIDDLDSTVPLEYSTVGYAFDVATQHFCWKLQDMKDFESIDELAQAIDKNSVAISVQGKEAWVFLEVLRMPKNRMTMMWNDNGEILWQAVYEKEC